MRFLFALALIVLTGCAPTAPGRPWSSPVGRQHPLAGRIWDVTAQRFVTPETLIDRLAADRFVLLGETHDNPDHHRLQAWVVEHLLATGRRPAVAFEMISPEEAPALARYLERAPRDAAGLGEALNWKKSGWPDWRYYEPIVQAALDAGVPVVSANLTRATVRALVHDGLPALEPGVADRLALATPAPAGADEAAREEIRDSHCGKIPESMIGGMAAVQRARDAQMADAMVAAAGDGAVLIAGRGHVRADRAVPFFLGSRQPGARVGTLAFVEVEKRRTAPSEYAETFGGSLPFDWIWFTPGQAPGTDPCTSIGQSR